MRYRLSTGRFVALFAFVGLLSTAALAQEQGGGQQAPTPAPAPGQGQGQGQTAPGREQPFPGREQSPFPSQQQQQQQQRMPEMQRPIFLQGKVMMDDGTPAPPSVVIERVCNGRPIPEAYTDSKGRFSFQVGQNSNFIADASFGGMEQMNTRQGGSQGGFGGMGDSMGGPSTGVSERELMGCELRASLAGYRSTTVELTGRRMFDNPDVGTLILRRLANVEGLTISATTLNAPKDAKKAYEKGIKEASKQKWDKASVELEKAVSLYPEYALAWQNLGQIYEAQKQDDKARDAYGKALAADPKFINPYLKLALLDAKQQNWRGVADSTDRVIKMNPYDFPDAFFYNAVAHLNLQNSGAAEKSAREALKLNAERRFPQVEHVLGLALAQQNNFDEAKLHLKKYLELVPQAQNADVVKQQLSQIEAFTAKNQPTQQ